MTARREDWPARLTDAIANQVRACRARLRMTAQQLVDGCEALGLPMKRTTLTNLENGRRGNVTVAELLALAKVLKVPPMHLLFGDVSEVEVSPGVVVPVGEAVAWFTGDDHPLPKTVATLSDAGKAMVLSYAKFVADQEAQARAG